ncbi:hypothetical protein QWZ13_13020 [Reinekea marina]|uniref:Thrombospondin type 3 repeat-containing protein n=1 Tax=Reinekea marina TaxID=1310421 RepID=A0ABV7WW94_9GAMM|nr:hypothetical protein [Reinekea marina]MDN3649835.1 hypothetical protein [Reinekea marina]
MSLRILKKKNAQLAFLLIAVFATLTSCQWENRAQTSLNVSVGYQSESARFADRASISSVYPSIGTIWVSIETPTLNVVQINEQYNNGQLTLNTAKSAIKITDTNVSLNVPTDETLTVSIEAFNIANLKVFSGSTEVAPEALGGASVQVTVPIQADIDASVPILASDENCKDTDDDFDGICGDFEDLFLNALGHPDIDGDNIINSKDPDSDGDGVLDKYDRNESSLVSGYTVSNDGFPMFLVPNTRPTIQNFTLSVIDTTLHTMELPLSSEVDNDVNDEITYWVVGNLPLGVSARTIGNTLEYQYTGVLLASLLSHTIQIEAYDIAALSLIESENPPGPVTFEVKVEVLPGVGLMF